MTKKRIVIRMILLVIVTIVFIGAFYFFFKNSRASSPLQDKEYMEQLAATSERYKIAGDPIITPTPTLLDENDKQNNLDAFYERIYDFFAELFN